MYIDPVLMITYHQAEMERAMVEAERRRIAAERRAADTAEGSMPKVRARTPLRRVIRKTVES